MSTKGGSQLPGRFLLRVARFIFEEPALSTIIEPAIADFQREVQDSDAATRRAVRRRGYVALCQVMLFALFVPGAGAGAPLTHVLLGLSGGSSLALLAPLLFAAVWPIFGLFTVGAVLAGMALAVGLRVWNSQHPAEVACTRRTRGKDPEINLSSIPVGGNIGGFFFVLASSLTILLGLPEWRGFVLGSVVGGTVFAFGLFAWHRAHMVSPVRRIVVS